MRPRAASAAGTRSHPQCFRSSHGALVALGSDRRQRHPRMDRRQAAIHHGRDNRVMTNDPPYNERLALVDYWRLEGRRSARVPAPSSRPPPRTSTSSRAPACRSSQRSPAIRRASPTTRRSSLPAATGSTGCGPSTSSAGPGTWNSPPASAAEPALTPQSDYFRCNTLSICVPYGFHIERFAVNLCRRTNPAKAAITPGRGRSPPPAPPSRPARRRANRASSARRPRTAPPARRSSSFSRRYR